MNHQNTKLTISRNLSVNHLRTTCLILACICKKNPEQITNNSSDVLFFPSDVFGFFANGVETEASGLDVFYQKDLALWNNTLQDFLIYDDGQH